jgi:hypothetical protein
MASEAGKGDKRRPTDENKYGANFDAIFRRALSEVEVQELVKQDAIDKFNVVKKQLDKEQKV